MKTKFESNVAAQIPKTRSSQEPQLPWEISKYDIDQNGFLEDAAQSLADEKVPFGIRPVFLAVLLIFMFASTLYVFVRVAEENKKARMSLQKKEKAIVLLQANLEKTVDEKDTLKERAARLQNDIADLNIRNKTFIGVIENLSKKNEAAAADKRGVKKE